MSNDDVTLLCKDCAYSFVPWIDKISMLISPSAYWHKCRRTGKVVEVNFNPVTGGKKLPADYQSCSSERGYSGSCGKDAKYWTPKHKHDLFKLLTR